MTAAAPRALIADDERLMREQLRARLAEAWPELAIVGEAKNGAEAVALAEREHPDLAFLDIRMPGMTGVEAARAIAQLPTDDDSADGWPGCEIVFVTAYDEYAVQAFEAGAADYVLKPAEPERLARTAERLKKRLAARAAGGDDAPPGSAGPAMQQLVQRLAAPKPRLQWIQAGVGAEIRLIPIDDVLYFASDEKYTRVQTAAFEALIRKPIKELVEELDAAQFWQIHRGTLVAVRAIAGVARDERGRQIVSIRGRPDKLEVSRSFSGLFKGM